MKKPYPMTRWLSVLILSAGLGHVANLAHAARCSEDLLADKADKSAGGKALSKLATAPKVDVPEMPLDPITQLQMIAREAGSRSASLGAARLLSEAAEYDVAETKAGQWPQVSVNGSLMSSSTQADTAAANRLKQASLSLNVQASLYDGGRLNQLTKYRQEVWGAAKWGAAVTHEQVVLEAISAALERSRYKLHAQVYQQYMRKMGCLVEALESIVAEDKGRGSELVQVRKTQAQTELQRDQALSQSRQSEFKLRKFVGDLQVPGEGITLPLAVVPEIGEINRQIEFGNDAQQLRVQADAMDSYAKAVVAGQRPQLNWNVGKTQLRQGSTPVSSWQAGVTVSYSLFNGFSDEAASQAANKRAQAARAQLSDLLNTKYARTSEVYDVATSAFERAKRYVDVLRDSERVRNFTFQQWSQIGKRSLFDVMSAESDHFNIRIAYVNALYDGYQASAQLRSMGSGLTTWLLPEQQR
ncbi:MAG: TolC family protein [Polaromonas sp.]|nr:TolC family protein [Polaromonas sp.]